MESGNPAWLLVWIEFWKSAYADGPANCESTSGHVAFAGDDDRPRGAGLEGTQLAAISGEPWGVLVPQAGVESEAIRDLEVVVHVAVPVVRLPAKRVGRKCARDLPRIPEEEVSEGITCAGRARRILGDRSIEVPLPRVLLAVGEERDPAAELAAELHDVTALDPSEVVGHLPDLQILCLGSLIERRSVHRGVAAPAEVRKRAADTRSRRFLEPADVGAGVLICALQVGLEIDGRRQVAESDLVEKG